MVKSSVWPHPNVPIFFKVEFKKYISFIGHTHELYNDLPCVCFIGMPVYRCTSISTMES